MGTMLVTRKAAAEKIAAYLHHQISLAQLVDWAEQQIMDADFDSPESRDAAARLGVADVRAFGLTWEECEAMLRKLGYNARVEIMAG